MTQSDDELLRVPRILIINIARDVAFADDRQREKAGNVATSNRQEFCKRLAIWDEAFENDQSPSDQFIARATFLDLRFHDEQIANPQVAKAEALRSARETIGDAAQSTWSCVFVNMACDSCEEVHQSRPNGGSKAASTDPKAEELRVQIIQSLHQEFSNLLVVALHYGRMPDGVEQELLGVAEAPLPLKRTRLEGILKYAAGRLPRVLVIDDQWGSRWPGLIPNGPRRSFCEERCLVDETGDTVVRIPATPIARLVFVRGQQPACSPIGATVENDLDGTLELIRAGWEGDPANRWSCVMVDMEFLTGQVTERSCSQEPGKPEGNATDRNSANYFGMQLVAAINRSFPDLQVVVLSSKSQDPISAECSQQSIPFLSKKPGSKRETAGRDEFQEIVLRYGLYPDEQGEIIGFSLSLLKALRTARQMARYSNSFLVTGETGTGKESLAKFVFAQLAGFRDGPVVPVDCGAFSKTLIESELFGHARRAFNDAEQHVGAIERANGGTLFLDEIHNLPLDSQAKLLRVMEEGELVPVGGDFANPVSVDVRFIAATNEKLEERIRQKSFRQDLYFRVAAATLRLPPLRERIEDLPILIAHFLQQQGEARMFAEGTIRALSRLPWPGNVRELRDSVKIAIGQSYKQPILFPHHFFKDGEMPRELAENAVQPVAHKLNERNKRADASLDAPVNISQLLAMIESFEFPEVQAELEGRLPLLWSSVARLLARFMEAALVATTSPPLSQKIIKISEAASLSEGQPMTQGEPGRLLKRLISIDEFALQEMLSGGSSTVKDDNQHAPEFLAKATYEHFCQPSYQNVASKLGRRLHELISTMPVEAVDELAREDPVLGRFLHIWYGAKYPPTGSVATAFVRAFCKTVDSSNSFVASDKIKAFVASESKQSNQRRKATSKTKKKAN